MFSLTRKPGDNTQYGTIGCCGTKLTKLVQALTESRRWFCLQGAYSVRYKESGEGGNNKTMFGWRFYKVYRFTFLTICCTVMTVLHTLT